MDERTGMGVEGRGCEESGEEVGLKGERIRGGKGCEGRVRWRLRESDEGIWCEGNGGVGWEERKGDEGKVEWGWRKRRGCDAKISCQDLDKTSMQESCLILHPRSYIILQELSCMIR